MRVFALLATVFSLAPAAASAEVTSDLIAPYLRIQVALAADSVATVKADAGLIAAEAGRLGPSGAAMKTAASELADASNLNVARAAFGRLSEALIAFTETDRPAVGSDLNVAFCPMVKKSWIQKGTAIQNPYGGKSMQSCGSITRAIK